VGQSDRYGESPVADPITPADVGATMLELAGVLTADRAEKRILQTAHLIDALF
jgi:uncharacterized protein YjbK